MLSMLVSQFIAWGVANPSTVQGAVDAMNKQRAVDASQFQGFADMSQ